MESSSSLSPSPTSGSPLGLRPATGDLGDLPPPPRSPVVVDGYRLECSRLHGHQMREYRAVDIAHVDGKTVTVMRVHRLLDATHCRQKLRWLAHRNVLCYRDSFVHDADVHLVSEAKTVDVLGYLRSRDIPVGRHREQLVRKWTGEILEALVYGRSLGLHHGDLNWREVHLDVGLEASIADFAGLTVDGESVPCPVRSCAAAAAESTSVGKAVFQLLFDGDADDIAVASSRLNQPADCDEPPDVSSHAKDFLRRMLITDDSHRLDIEDALLHPWMQPSIENFFAPSVTAFKDADSNDNDDDGGGSQDVELLEAESDESSWNVAKVIAASSIFANVVGTRSLPVAAVAGLLVFLLASAFDYYRQTDDVHPTLFGDIVLALNWLFRTALDMLL